MIRAEQPLRGAENAYVLDKRAHSPIASIVPSAIAASVPQSTDRIPNSVSVGGLGMAEPVGPRKPLRRLLKRVMDIVVAGTALVVLSPVLLMIATALWFSGTGPVLFVHPRVGRGGRMFRCFKFRTMHVDGDRILDDYLRENPEARRMWEADRKLLEDPRITSLGHVLRKTSLDELPQFYNILIGDMSCVGPRPVASGELERYGEHRAEYLSVRPGLTGIWQISGRSRLPYTHRVLLDADYVRRWSLRRDLMIMIKTVPAVLKLDEAA